MDTVMVKDHRCGLVKRFFMRRSIKAGLTWAAVLALQLASILAHAVALTDIDFSSQSGGKVEIRLTFDSPPPQPKGYTIDKPARIALDLPGVNSLLAQKKHTLDFDNAQSVVVLEAGGRTRVIINLVELAAYDAQVQGSELVVLIGNDVVPDYLKSTDSELSQLTSKPASDTTSATATATGSETAVAAELEARTAVSGDIASLDFQRGDAGEGKLVLGLMDPKIGVDVRLEGSSIKISMPGASVSPDLQRRYDVMDFATPVRQIDVKQEGTATEIEMEVFGEYDYLAYQADNVYVVSVKPLTEEEVEAKKKEFAYVGNKLSLNFQDIDVRAVLQLIADFTDLNLVASDTVSGKITLRLQNVPWDQALDLILKTKGLDKRQVGNVLLVAPAAEIAERERQEVETNKQIQELAPLQTEFIKILYADAMELFKLFEGEDGGGGGGGEGTSTSSILSPRGKVIVDERTNSLLVTETAEKLDEFRRLIKLIDVPVRQVQIEARIVVANSDFDQELGIDWTANSQSGQFSLNGNDLSGDVAIDFPVARQGVSTFAVGFTPDDLILNLELSALEAAGAGEVVSQPKIITQDKRQASIESGQEIAYQTASSSGETTIEFKDAVLRLEVTPRITPDDRIIMELRINQDSIAEFVAGEFGALVPILDTTELTTEVLVNNGQTIVLGGIFQTEDVNTVSKTPFLGDIPYLGRLFKHSATIQTKAEILIFITPSILADRLLD